MNRHLLFSICFLPGLVTHPRSEAQSQQEIPLPTPGYRAEELKLTLQSSKPLYAIDEPIPLAITIRNISSQEQRIKTYGPVQCSYWMKLTDEHENEVGTHRFISKDGNMQLPINSSKRVQSFNELTEKVELQAFFTLPGVGRYRLRALRFRLIGSRLSLEMNVRTGKPLSFAGSIESNEIDFEIR